MERTDFSSYQQEWEDSLQEIAAAGMQCPALSYFIDLARDYYQPEKLMSRDRRVIMIDMSFPVEIVRALGVDPLFLPGGSFAASMWAENMVPRDTDAVVKAVLGMLTNQTLKLAENSIVLIPVNCDSMRKFPDILAEYHCTVIPVEVPSNKTAPNLMERWKNEVRGVTQQLERKLRKKLRTSALSAACIQYAEARAAYQQLEQACSENPGVLSGVVRLFLSNTYLWDASPTSWAEHIRTLTEQVSLASGTKRNQPQILIVGSPVYFPNYKVPFLLESLRMDLAAAINPVSISLLEEFPEEPCKQLLDQVALHTLAADISPAFVENDTLFLYMQKLVREKHINGAILHIIKGQIEYDFEMRRYEEYLEKQNIPIFRLETDYNYQDFEQLRIRLEAFSEMTTHKMQQDAKLKQA